MSTEEPLTSKLAIRVGVGAEYSPIIAAGVAWFNRGEK